MKCIGQIRRERLHELKRAHGMTLAELNEKLGRERRDATLSQILNGSPNTRTGRAREMGNDQARAIEAAFGLEHGWLDMDPDFEQAQQKLAAASEQPSALRATEASGQYSAWPFRRMRPESILSIPKEDLARLEDYMLGFVSGLRFGRDQPSTSEHTQQPG